MGVFSRAFSSCFEGQSQSPVHPLALGFFYNNFSVADIRQLAPDSWRVATLDDVINVIDYLGGTAISGGKMKALEGWDTPNTGTDNESGLTVFGTGRRDELGIVADKLIKTSFWYKQI